MISTPSSRLNLAHSTIFLKPFGRDRLERVIRRAQAELNGSGGVAVVASKRNRWNGHARCRESSSATEIVSSPSRWRAWSGYKQPTTT